MNSVDYNNARAEKALVQAQDNLAAANARALRMRERADMLENFAASEDAPRAVVAQIRSVILKDKTAPVSDQFKIAAIECFDNFKQAAYEATIKLKLRKVAASAYALMFFSPVFMLTAMRFPDTLQITPTGLGVTAVAAAGLFGFNGLSRGERSDVHVFAPIRKCITGFARKKFETANAETLRRQFVAAWEKMMSPAGINQQDSIMDAAAARVLHTDDKAQGVDGINVALAKTFNRELTGFIDFQDLRGYFKHPFTRPIADALQTTVEALPVRSIKELFTKPEKTPAA